MPTNIEILRDQARGFNPVSVELQGTYFNVETSLDLQGKRNYLDIISGFVSRQNRIKENNIQETARNNENINRITEDNEQELQDREEVVRRAEREHLEIYKAIALANLSDREKNRQRESARKQAENARKEFEAWKQQTIDGPIHELQTRNNLLAFQNTEIDENVENVSRYIDERQRREGILHQDVNNNRRNVMKDAYKGLVRAYESHGWFAKWWGSIWPDAWTQAGRDLAALEEGGQILLNAGYSADEIVGYEREVLQENQPHNEAVTLDNSDDSLEDSYMDQPPEINIGEGVREEERKEQENLPFVSDEEEIEGDAKNKGYDLNDSRTEDLEDEFKELFNDGSKNKNNENGGIDQIKTNNIQNNLSENINIEKNVNKVELIDDDGNELDKQNNVDKQV